MQRMNTGRVGYNGLQLRLQKRLSQGLAFVAAYAFSKTMVYEQRSVVNERVHKTVSPSDTPHIFRSSATWDVPFGRGRAWGRNVPAALDWLLGGWGIGWQTKYTSGAALAAEQSKMGNPIPIADPTTSGSIHDRLGDQTDAAGNVLNPWFDKAAFQPLADTYAISPTALRYGWIRGPYSFFHNAALFKTISFSDRFKLELRIEADNVFNSPQFADPNDPLDDNPVMDISDPNFGVITASTNERTRPLRGQGAILAARRRASSRQDAKGGPGARPSLVAYHHGRALGVPDAATGPRQRRAKGETDAAVGGGDLCLGLAASAGADAEGEERDPLRGRRGRAAHDQRGRDRGGAAAAALHPAHALDRPHGDVGRLGVGHGLRGHDDGDRHRREDAERGSLAVGLGGQGADRTAAS